MERNKQVFDIRAIPLQGSCLIEASAGTGKTYSVTLLALRMLLEKNTDIRNLLIVTFTRAAVAELEERIRKVVRNSYNHIFFGEAIDPAIREIIQPHLSEGRELVKINLKNALLHLDELSIYTIHGFCQQMLSEFAFETGQLFGVELLSDQSEIIERGANKFWREQIAVLDIEIVEALQDAGLNRDRYLNVIREGMGYAKLLHQQEHTPGNLKNTVHNFKQKAQEILDRFTQHFKQIQPDFQDRMQKSRYAIGLLEDKLNQPKELLEALISKRNTQYIQKLFKEEGSYINAYAESLEKIEEASTSCLHYLYAEAIQFVKKEVDKIKHQQQLISFNDLIRLLHRSLAESEILRKQIGEKFEAVFIDEFQDTDRLQYDIFHSIFGQGHPLFFIGDPKQSIYAWRGADLETYKKAASEVEHSYTMKTNYRSTEDYINSCNLFFAADDDPFTDPMIQYEQVNAPSEGSSAPPLLLDGTIQKSLSIGSGSKSDDIISQVVELVYRLLSQNYYLGNKKVEESDITILIRGKDQGKKLKQALLIKGIQAASRDDTTILESEEAKAVWYLMKAIYEPDRKTIHRALLGPFTTLTSAQILRLDQEQEFLRFRILRRLWEEEGIFESLHQFLQSFQVTSFLLSGKNPLGERILSNFMQLAELLHQTEYRKKYKAPELIRWLGKNIETNSNEDSYLQRIESDEKAVNISTIHSSKGLAYPIVIAPFLNLKSSNRKGQSLFFTDPQSKERVFSLLHTEDALALSAKEQEQENRRLIYVAMTRAISKCFLFDNLQVKDNFLHRVVESIQGMEPFDFMEALEPGKSRWRKEKQGLEKRSRIFNGQIKQDWSVLSFSKLNIHESHSPPAENPDSLDPYSNFAFKQLGKGPHIGNFLHDLIEAYFTTYREPEDLLQNTGLLHSHSYKKDLDPMYLQMLEEVSKAVIPANEPFCLADTSQENRLAEMEFYFDLAKVQPKQLKRLIPQVRFNESIPIKGLMTGFIDLFLELKGCYYLIDWKSNYLGDQPHLYEKDHLEESMTEHNYHLQYYIYIVAVHRFLQSRIPNYDYDHHFGGVVYFFLRAVRSHTSQGIFFAKPPKEDILELDRMLSNH